MPARRKPVTRPPENLGKDREHGSSRAAFRKLTRDDRDAFERHLPRLDPEDRRLRFWAAVRGSVISDYFDRLDWHAALLIGAFGDGDLRGVGKLLRVRTIPNLLAEVALSVEGPWQNEGIGTELMRRVLNGAYNRYIDRVCMVCLAENKNMQSISRKFEANLIHQLGEVEGRIWSAWPSYLSLMEEASHDGHAFWNAVFDPAMVTKGGALPWLGVEAKE
ncbi:MAG: GNAT family N-acetyltransferase [Rhodospirillaceae bacterium]